MIERTTVAMDAVLIADLAQEFGIERTHCRRWVVAQGLRFIRVRASAYGNQVMIALSAEDAESARRLRREQGYLPRDAPLRLVSFWEKCMQIGIPSAIANAIAS